MAYIIFSPDGFPIHPTDTYPNMDEAKNKFDEWLKRYEQQGYYSCKGERIPLVDVGHYCELIELKEEETCPNCNRTNTRKDFDFPDTMRCCDDCGADYLNDGELILDPNIF